MTRARAASELHERRTVSLPGNRIDQNAAKFAAVGVASMAKHLATLLWMSASLAAVSLALPTNDKNGSENDLMATIYADCLKKESISCIKYKVFTYVDKMLADKEDITLSEGITVVKTSNAEEGAPRSVVRRTRGTRCASSLVLRLDRLKPLASNFDRRTENSRVANQVAVESRSWTARREAGSRARTRDPLRVRDREASALY